MWLELQGTDVLHRGWPLLMDVVVSYPVAWKDKLEEEGRPVPPLRVIPEAGGWDSLVEIHIYTPGMRQVALPLTLATNKPKGELVLEKEYGGVLRWHLSPEETLKLEPGHYTGLALLESSHGSKEGGWTGAVSSVPIEFDVVDEPSPLPVEQTESKAISFAQYELYRHAPAAALTILDAHLSSSPESPAALFFKAQMKEEEGALEEAHGLYAEALRAHLRKYPNEQEPPFEIMDRLSALLRKLNSLHPQ